MRSDRERTSASSASRRAVLAGENARPEGRRGGSRSPRAVRVAAESRTRWIHRAVAWRRPNYYRDRPFGLGNATGNRPKAVVSRTVGQILARRKPFLTNGHNLHRSPGETWAIEVRGIAAGD